MGIAESALLLLGIGIISSKFKAGVGLGELGTGVQKLVAAPLAGTGAGLFGLAGGLRSLAESFGDIGRGIGEIFKFIPKFGEPFIPMQPPSKTITPLPLVPSIPPLVTVSGGNKLSLDTGGGGSVPSNGPIMTIGSDIGPVTGTRTQLIQFYTTRGIPYEAAYSIVNPFFTSMNGGNLV